MLYSFYQMRAERLNISLMSQLLLSPIPDTGHSRSPTGFAELASSFSTARATSKYVYKEQELFEEKPIFSSLSGERDADESLQDGDKEREVLKRTVGTIKRKEGKATIM